MAGHSVETLLSGVWLSVIANMSGTEALRQPGEQAEKVVAKRRRLRQRNGQHGHLDSQAAKVTFYSI